MDPCKMQEARQNACVNIAQRPVRSSDRIRDSRRVLRRSNAGRNVRNIPPISVLDLRAQPLAFRIMAGRSDPRPGVTPGVAEGAEEGGRSCPLRGLSRTAGRARNAAYARANVVEVQTFR